MQEMADWAERSERGIQYVKDFMDEISKTLVDAYHLWRDLVVESTVTGRDRRTLAEVVGDILESRCRAGVNLAVNRAKQDLRTRSGRC